MMHKTRPLCTTVDETEQAHFAALQDSWWDPDGPLRALHAMNPPRLEFITHAVRRHWHRDDPDEPLLAGLEVLDVGCGGGLLSEPLCRLAAGQKITAIDTTAESIRAAQDHATRMGLAIDYRHVAAEDLLAEGCRYDVVTCMEVIEHVADQALLFYQLATLVRPGGVLILSTLNRTLLSLALAKVAAEYLLRLVPRGTHQWQKFVRPAQMQVALHRHGLHHMETRGIVPDPLHHTWRLSKRTGINYIMALTRPAS